MTSIWKAGAPTAVCALAVVAFAAGCGKRPDKEGDSPKAGVESNAVRAAAGGIATNTGPKTLAMMAPDDVVVSVNGVTLTKRECDLGMKRIIKQLSEIKNPQRGQQMRMLQMASRLFIPRFVSSQLLVQEARRVGVLGEDEVKKRADKLIAESAKKAKQEVAVFEKGYVGGAEALRKEVEQSVLISALIASNVPPKFVVDDAFMAATMASIKADNDAIAMTNGMKVARLKELRAAVAGGADFGKLADENSECERSAPGINGHWGDFEKSEFSNRKMRDAVFALRPGEVSDVLEDDEGYHLVKMIEHTPAKKNEKGLTVQPESALLAHILLRKVPLLEVEAAPTLKADLEKQMQQQALDEYIEGLRARANIVYPNGTKFWPESSAQQAVPPAR